jgi:hypothetical protein
VEQLGREQVLRRFEAELLDAVGKRHSAVSRKSISADAVRCEDPLGVAFP